jgi:hypothetical protein
MSGFQEKLKPLEKCNVLADTDSLLFSEEKRGKNQIS